jgi:adenosylcobinamide-GDP ribazoletransferase
VVAAGSGAVLAAALVVSLPALPAAAFAVAASVALSGALHLDGLADVADGFGGGRTREAKLAIMRDSRIGVYGGSAVALALITRVALVAALAEADGAAAVFGLIAAAALARPLALLPTLLLRPARSDGLGQAARPRAGAVAAGCCLGAAAAALGCGVAAGAAAAILAAAAALAVAALARRQIGGYTGDVCGATAEVAELAALAALAAAGSGWG